jgi:hypothetical protein
MGGYVVTVQVSYEVYIRVDADNEEEAKATAIKEAHNAGMIWKYCGYTYNFLEEPKIVSVEKGGE